MADVTTTTTDPAADPGAGDDDDQLGDAGRRALAQERTARRTAERAANAARAELDRIRAESQSETDKAIAKAKAEGSAEALAKANDRVLRAEVKALAAGKLADPADAVALLDLSEFTVGDDGAVDAKAVGKAIDQLVKDKPYLAAGQRSAATTGSADGGARGTGTKPVDMNAWLRGEPGVRL